MATIHKRKKTRWNRICILFAAIAIILGFTCQALGNSEAAEFPLQKVVVVHGDTLWGLIEAHNGSVKNMNKAVYEVKQINGLDNAAIYVGQILYMPTNLK